MVGRSRGLGPTERSSQDYGMLLTSLGGSHVGESMKRGLQGKQSRRNHARPEGQSSKGGQLNLRNESGERRETSKQPVGKTSERGRKAFLGGGRGRTGAAGGSVDGGGRGLAQGGDQR